MDASARSRASLSILASIGLALSAQAQNAAPSSAPRAETSPALAPAAVTPKAGAPEAPRRPRAISPEVAAQLAANTPKFSPQPKPEPKPESAQVDLRDIDKPRNEIPRLDPYIVREAKPPVFTERSISTPAGLADIAMRRYITEFDRAMNRFSLPLVGSSAADRALALYAEDERLQNMAAMNDAANTISKSDSAAGEYVRREAQKTFMRTSDFGRNSDSSKSWHSEAGAAVRSVSGTSSQR